MTLLQSASERVELDNLVQGTFERIEDMALNQRCASVILAGARIYVRGDAKRFVCEVPMDQLDAERLQIDQLDWLDASEDVMQNVSDRGRPLDELLWTLGWHRSGGQLSDQCRRNDVVRFSRWPNLTRLPTAASTHRIIALLTARPSSIVLASRLLGVPEAEVAQVYSAGMAAGYAMPINRQVEAPVVKPHRHKSLIGRLIKRLQRD